MTRKRKLLFSAIVVALVFIAIEGTAQVIWWRLESRALQERQVAGQEVLRQDGLNYMKEPHGLYGFIMKPNFARGDLFVSEQGFHQRDVVPVARPPRTFRVVCLGESTTFGNLGQLAIDGESNYPAFLKDILASEAAGYDAYEVINAGVPGWVSEQVALRAEHELARFAPDAVILYVGWNDFQSYNPLGPLETQSYFETAYKGRAWKHYTVAWLKSVALLSALYYKDAKPDIPSIAAGDVSPDVRYRFLLQSLDRIAAAFRHANPDVTVFIATLAGRWPEGTDEEWSKIAPVWWMKSHDVSVADAASYLAQLNATLTRYAAARNLPLIDVAHDFQDLDRARLQFDWAHMHADGYELVAWSILDALAREGLVTRRDASSRAEALRARYAVRVGDAAPASGVGRR